MELEGGILQLVGLLVLIIWRLVDWLTARGKGRQPLAMCERHQDLVDRISAQSLELRSTNLHLDEIARELRLLRLGGGEE